MSRPASRFLHACALLLALAAPVHAQDPPAPGGAPPDAGAATAAPDQAPMAAGSDEWTIGGGPAFGFEIFHSAEGHNYALQTISWGRVLSGPKGPGWVRGQFQWAVEATPVFGQYQPDRVYGFGLSPIVWRWNFDARGQVRPFVELAGGLLWTNAPVPLETTSTNFTAHGGGGVRLMLAPAQGLVVSYRLHHISNGNRLKKNPGVNAHVVYVGWTVLR